MSDMIISGFFPKFADRQTGKTAKLLKQLEEALIDNPILTPVWVSPYRDFLNMVTPQLLALQEQYQRKILFTSLHTDGEGSIAAHHTLAKEIIGFITASDFDQEDDSASIGMFIDDIKVSDLHMVAEALDMAAPSAGFNWKDMVDDGTVWLDAVIVPG